MKAQLIDRLSRYVKIDTQSNPESSTTPSTEKQWDLLRLLQQELEGFGLETNLDDNGYLFATLKAMYLSTSLPLGSWHMLIHHRF